MIAQEVNKLNAIADQMRDGGGDEDCFWALSTSARLYIALAANRFDLLEECGYTIVAAVGRIGPDWAEALLKHWEYR